MDVFNWSCSSVLDCSTSIYDCHCNKHTSDRCVWSSSRNSRECKQGWWLLGSRGIRLFPDIWYIPLLQILHLNPNKTPRALYVIGPRSLIYLGVELQGIIVLWFFSKSWNKIEIQFFLLKTWFYLEKNLLTFWYLDIWCKNVKFFPFSKDQKK